MTIKPRIVTALMSQGAALCHRRKVSDSVMAPSFFNTLGMFKCVLLQMGRALSVGARAVG
jgi:hypothetical protein